MKTETLRRSRGASRAQETLVTLFTTAARARQTFAAVVEAHGVTLQQLNVLRILRGAGPAGLPTMTLAKRMIERDPGVTKLIDRLERKRLVSRTRPPSDRRRVAVSITTRGLGLLTKLDEPIAEADAAIVADLSGKEQALLVTLLRRIRSVAVPTSVGRRATP